MSTIEQSPGEPPLYPDELTIRVINEGGAWMLECRPGFETLMFRSGGAAEAAGRIIAARFARSGQGVQMAIEDRRHAIVGTRTFFPLSGVDPAIADAASASGYLQ